MTFYLGKLSLKYGKFFINLQKFCRNICNFLTLGSWVEYEQQNDKFYLLLQYRKYYRLGVLKFFTYRMDSQLTICNSLYMKQRITVRVSQPLYNWRQVTSCEGFFLQPVKLVHYFEIQQAWWIHRCFIIKYSNSTVLSKTLILPSYNKSFLIL